MRSMKDEIHLKPIVNDNIIQSGMLKVSNGHEIYWVDWGNKSIKNPIFYIHGGPGSGFDESDFDKFDPIKHRVVFHDQRGSGRSTPFASIENNTTKDLIKDITKLKELLNFDKISLYGFSWGSTLALLYAINNPDKIEKMLIGGIYLARKEDNEFYLNGKTSTHFPEVWERFISFVPPEYRSKPAIYYKKMMFGNNEKNRKKFAKEWMFYEASILKLDYIPERIERSLNDFASESLSYLEAHYIFNNCFIDENFIIQNSSKLENIKIVIVQGRYDFICPPSGAYKLANSLKNKPILQIVMSGHSSSDTVQREVVKAYLNSLF